MLESLSIKNFAIIDDLVVKFSSGFNVITGETGAGKSIMVQALGLTLGERADSSSLRDKSQKCVVELEVNLEKLAPHSFFTHHDLDYSNHTVVRREINSEGKSRAFINDTPVNLSVLKEFSHLIVDLHSQHQNLDAADAAFRLHALDRFAGNGQQVMAVQNAFKQFAAQRSELENLKQKESDLKKNLDFNQFQWQELSEANLREGMMEELESEQRRLENTGEIKNLLAGTLQAFEAGEFALLSQLSSVKGLLSSLVRLDGNTQPYLDRAVSSLVELKDLSQELDRYAEGITDNPQRLEEVNSILDKVYRLLRKHNLQQVEQLIALKQELELSIDQAENFDAEIAKAQTELNRLLGVYGEAAAELSQTRKRAAKDFSTIVSKQLIALAMPNAVFEIQLNAVTEPGPNGQDAVVWMFSSNKGSELKDAAKSASGGELSRLMLAIKGSLAQKAELPSLILDEIDTGVSGEVAAKIANLMKGIAQNMQVVAITHLPQVAARAHHHLFVFKGDLKGKTTTQIKVLDVEERVNAVAAMLSDGNISLPALENARALIDA
ncbi:MAG: DNA repair protein RecN [Bacteroidia bacterium]|nr:DNA repair protein RecN [Bacteroidia bacterium]